MNRSKSIAILLLSAPLLLGIGVALADRDGDEHEGYWSRWFDSPVAPVETPDSARYQEECGSCHFPYQPGFLPTASWVAIMSSLDDHFGDNAQMDAVSQRSILEYLAANSADAMNREIPNKVIWSLRYTPNPQRVTETAFFRHEHDEIADYLQRRSNPDISFSNCDTCHSRAMQGFYDERDIRVPGLGRWDD
ncbi:MAG: cytochrome C [Candidatus Thiodiazotropha sp.]